MIYNKLIILFFIALAAALFQNSKAMLFQGNNLKTWQDPKLKQHSRLRKSKLFGRKNKNEPKSFINSNFETLDGKSGYFKIELSDQIRFTSEALYRAAAEASELPIDQIRVISAGKEIKRFPRSFIYKNDMPTGAGYLIVKRLKPKAEPELPTSNPDVVNTAD